MRVTIDDSVFMRPDGTGDLIEIIRHGVSGRHRILTDPIFSSSEDQAVNRWLNSQSRELVTELQFGLESSLQAEAQDFPPELTLRVSDRDATSWKPPTLCLPPQIACKLLVQPLRILVENLRNDGAFARRMMPGGSARALSWHKRFSDFEREGWIEFENAGGLSEMGALLDTKTEAQRLRLVGLFDSDAREPGAPSAISRKVAERFSTSGVPAHQLRRRASENYLPPRVIGEWIGLNFGAQDSKHQCYLAFKALSAECRHHFHMRDGLNKDLRCAEGLSPIFADLPPRVAQALHNGFGTNLRDLLNSETCVIEDSWLDDDGQREERESLARTVFRRA